MSAVAHTEESMLALLAKRYRGEQRGNGPAWAFVPKVRNAAGFNATRTIDAIAMSLWPSRGLELHGHEIKVSRSDWLRELKDPAKAEAFTEQVDRWWLVVSDASIVQEGELPPTWGLMVATSRGLKVTVQAPPLPPTDTPWMPKTFLAALLRASARTQEVTPAEIEAALAAAKQQWDEHHAKDIERWRESRDELRTAIHDFETAAGVSLRGWSSGRSPSQVGAALKIVLNGDADLARFTQRFEGLARQAETLATDLREAAQAGELVA